MLACEEMEQKWTVRVCFGDLSAPNDPACTWPCGVSLHSPTLPLCSCSPPPHFGPGAHLHPGGIPALWPGDWLLTALQIGMGGMMLLLDALWRS